MSFFVHEHIYRDLTPAADKLVTICGTGALGANLAETLARMGLRRLRVIDRDRVEAHNLSTQPWAQQDIGAPKARVLANTLYRAVASRVEPHYTALTRANAASLLSGSAVIVDAFDNIPSRAAVNAAAAALGVPCLHIAIGLGGDYGCGLWDNAYKTDDWQPSDEKNKANQACDYPLTRPLALLVVAAAAEVLVGYLLNGQKRGFEVTLRDLYLVTTAD